MAQTLASQTLLPSFIRNIQPKNNGSWTQKMMPKTQTLVREVRSRLTPRRSSTSPVRASTTRSPGIS